MANLGGSVYDREYFSGSQVSVYIGDVWVDEVVMLDYTVSENRAPIYGYASRRFDAVTNGNILVQGSFAINFKESGYLYVILQRYRDFLAANPGFESGPLWKFVNKTGHETLRANIERIVQDTQKKLGNRINSQDLTEMAYNIHGMLTRSANGSQPFDPDAENLFEEYENALWGDRVEGSTIAGALTYEGINPEINPGRKATDPSWGGFDLWITYGDYQDYPVKADLKNHTIRKLFNVHLLGCQQKSDPSGENIIEVYPFIAQDMA